MLKGDEAAELEPVPGEHPVEPPWELSPDAAEVWGRLAPDLIRTRVLTAWDVDLFAVFCEAVARYHQARRQVADEGLSIKGARGWVRHPAASVIADCERTMASLAGRFGLTPSDRSQLQIDPTERTGEGLTPERLLS